MGFWKRLAVIFGAVISVVPGIWQTFKWLLGWGEHIEFVAHRLHDIKYVGPMLELLLNPPPWLALALVPPGLVLVWWGVRATPNETKEHTEHPAEFSGDIPDMRVADEPSLVSLFQGEERDKLIPLLEAEKLTAWGRKGGPGEPPLTKIPGKLWAGHYLLFLPHRGEGTQNQTFIRPNGTYETIYFDVYLNGVQIDRVWPGLRKNETPLHPASAARSQTAESKTVTVRSAFSQTQSIKVLPPSLGGNSTLKLDNVATMRLHVPYSMHSVTLILDVVPVDMSIQHSPGVSVDGAKIYFHGSSPQFVFDVGQNNRREITVAGRTFVVTLLRVSRLNVADVANPIEYEFGISER